MSFDWTPDHSRMASVMPPRAAMKDLKGRVAQIVAERKRGKTEMIAKEQSGVQVQESSRSNAAVPGVNLEPSTPKSASRSAESCQRVRGLTIREG